MEKKQLITGLLMILMVITGAIVYYNYDMKRKKKIIYQMNEEYPSILINEALNGTITGIHQYDSSLFRDNVHFARVSISDSIKRSIAATNELSTRRTLKEVLRIGYHFKKKSNSSEFFIYEIQNGDTIKYHFALTDDSGYPFSDLKNSNRKER